MTLYGEGRGSSAGSGMRPSRLRQEEPEEDTAASGPGPDHGSPPGSWTQVRTRLIDTVIVVGVFAYNLLTDHFSVPDQLWPGAGVALAVGLCAPYLLRRRYPLAVFCTIFAVGLVQLLLGITLVAADAMLLFALYNLAARFRWTTAVPAGLAVIAWVIAAALPLLDNGYLNIGEVGVLVIVVVWVCTWGTLVGTRRKYIESLQARAEQLEREQQAHARIAAGEERARIAREMHDIVSHSLSVVVVMAEGAAAKTHSEPDRAHQAMVDVRDTGRTAMAEMRRMLGVLRSGEPGSDAPQPGIAQLEQLAEDSRRLGLPARLEVRGEPVPVPAGVDLAVYRVVQEALSNVRKHAGLVNRVEVRLDYRDTELEVRVVDDGRGPTDHGAEEAGEGQHGLVGMRERIHAYGGTLRAGMRPAGGFEVVARLPIEEGERVEP